MFNNHFPVQGAGLGLRRSMLDMLAEANTEQINFLEVAPENWINVGGRLGKAFRAYTERFDFVSHGLSLSIGSTDPLDVDLVRDIKAFLDTHQIKAYTEHLSYCSDSGHLYDLMPMPFTEEAVKHVSSRIRQVQDILERRIAMENVSYYCPQATELSELEFINAVIAESDCDLLLDVNNIYVNSINHGYNASDFLRGLPGDRAQYIHVAGHFDEADDLKVDTHGADVIDPVWQLLAQAYTHFGVIPTLLERDFNIPSLAHLLSELDVIKSLQTGARVIPAKQVSGL